MKNKGTGFLKQIISVITAMAKSKTLALKSKTRAIKTRLIIFSLLRNKKLMMSSISDKLRTLMSHQQDHHHHKKDDDDDDDEDEVGIDQNCSRAIVVHKDMSVHESVPNPTQTEEFVDDDEEQVDYENEDQENENESNNKYPDLTHSLFEDPGGSVIDLVKKSKPEGEEFRLEDEIDQVADLFIKRFHCQMRIQKQLSFKRYQEMLERSS